MATSTIKKTVPTQLLSAVNLDTVKSSFIGYAMSSTNSPSGVSSTGELLVVARPASNYVRQFYMPFNTNTLYIRNCNNGTWSTWEPIPTDVAQYNLPKANMTNISNASDGMIRFFTSGNIVMMQFYATAKIKTGGSDWVTLFTIPSGYRPKFQVRIPLIDDSAVSNGHAGIMEARINTDGNFQIYDPITNHAVWGSVITYFRA